MKLVYANTQPRMCPSLFFNTGGAELRKYSFALSVKDCDKCPSYCFTFLLPSFMPWRLRESLSLNLNWRLRAAGSLSPWICEKLLQALLCFEPHLNWPNRHFRLVSACTDGLFHCDRTQPQCLSSPDFLSLITVPKEAAWNPQQIRERESNIRGDFHVYRVYLVFIGKACSANWDQKGTKTSSLLK